MRCPRAAAGFTRARRTDSKGRLMKHPDRLGFLLEAAALQEILDACAGTEPVMDSVQSLQLLGQEPGIDANGTGRACGDRSDDPGTHARPHRAAGMGGAATDRQDRRASALTTTSKGRQLTDQMPHLLEVTSEVALRGLSTFQRRMLLSRLAQVRANLVDGAERLPPERHRPAQDLNHALWAAYGRWRD